MVDSVVSKGLSLPHALDDCLPESLSPENRSFVKALSFGTLRYYYRLDCILNHLLTKPLRNKEHLIRMLALIGLYQLAYMRVAPHAAVSTTVQAVGRKSWAKGLLNGILRNFQRQQLELETLADKNLHTKTAHPAWIVESIQDNWNSNAETLLINNNQQAPMVLRVNRLKYSRDNYLRTLQNTGIASQASLVSVDGIVLDNAVDVVSLPDFELGACYVQDTAAQLVAQCLDLKPNQRVGDLCAAPGGKAIHVLEICPEISELVAVEIDQYRVNTIAENAKRCGVPVSLHCANAVDLESWWDGEFFDRVMLDVPCSGTGVIRRHPDIKLLRKAEDIPALVKRQRDLLEAGWKVVSPGGVLLYSTCSVLKDENTEQISWFLNTHEDAQEWPIEQLDWIDDSHSTTPGTQVLTGTQGMDGFFYARLFKNNNAIR